MEETQMAEVTQPENSWKIQTLVIGGVVGALIGIGAAFLLTRNAEQKGTQLAITPRKGVQLGVLLAGLLRSIVKLGED
jgi:hypothetical protein